MKKMIDKEIDEEVESAMKTLMGVSVLSQKEVDNLLSGIESGAYDVEYCNDEGYKPVNNNQKIEYHYKIRNPIGKFSAGGADPSFEINGTIWKSDRALKMHFNLVRNLACYDDCEIIEYKAIVSELRIENLAQWNIRKQFEALID